MIRKGGGVPTDAEYAMGFEPNEEKRTVDTLPENLFEGGGADIDNDGLSAASPVAAPKRARLSVRSRSAAADSSAPQDTADAVKVKGMPPRTEESTPPPVRRPIMRPSSEFGYLFSDDEPVDNHMDDSYSRRLDGLAYEGRNDDEQYSSVMDGTQPSMVRRPENRMSAESVPSRPTQEPQPAERPSRFSRRNRSSAAEEAVPQPEVIAEPAISMPVPQEENPGFSAPSNDQHGFHEDDYRPRRRYDGDEYDPRDHRSRRNPERMPGYRAHQAAYPPYGQYPYPAGYPYPYGYPVPPQPQPGYPPYGYPVQPGYPPYAYPVPSQQGYPAYVYAIPTGMVYPAGAIPVQPLAAEPAVQQPVTEQPSLPPAEPEPVVSEPDPTPAETETPAEEEVLPHPLPPVSLLRTSGNEVKNTDPAPAPEKKPEEDKQETLPVSSGTGSSRFNRRSRSREDRPSVDFASTPNNDPFDSPSAEKPAAPAADSFDWFSDQSGDSFGSGGSSSPSSGGSSRFKRRSK